MTNSALLKAKMLASGYKMRYIAEKIGLSYQGMKNKIDNKHDFTASEIYALCELLHISPTERDIIFFSCE